MRFAPSSPEAALWRGLRARQFDGVQFRRQVPLAGRYIADFVASARKLVVEVDGPHHALQVAADARRDRVLQRLGYRILHLDAALVMRDLPAALALVRAALESR